MADVTELKWDGGDSHFDTSCWSWYDGLSVDEKVVFIEGTDEDTVVPVDDFKVEDYTRTKRTAACGCYQIIPVPEFWDENDMPRVYDIVDGDTVYRCDECDQSYPTREMAENCC